MKPESFKKIGHEFSDILNGLNCFNCKHSKTVFGPMCFTGYWCSHHKFEIERPFNYNEEKLKYQGCADFVSRLIREATKEISYK